MGNPTDTTPIIFSTNCNEYYETGPIISWTSSFSESVSIQHLTIPPFKELRRDDETWGTTTTAIELDRLLSPFIALQVYVEGYFRFYVGFQCFTSSDDVDLVNSTDIYLDSAGGTEVVPFDTDVRDFDWAIHCCVRSTLRCCVNELPVEILELIFWFSQQYDTKAIPLVCKRWRMVHVAFEREPSRAKTKLDRIKRFPVKRFKWTSCKYDAEDVDDFHEYIHAVVQFQPFLQYINITRPSRESALEDLGILAKVPTLQKVELKKWKFQEIFRFLKAGQHLKLYSLYIYDMSEGNQDLTDVTSSNVQHQLISVVDLYIVASDDSINKVLKWIQKDNLTWLEIVFDKNTFEPLKESIQLFGFKNLCFLTLDGGNDESNLVTFDFFSKTCTPKNLQNLRELYLYYCFVDLTNLQCLLNMPSLPNVEIVLFMGQKTDENERITNQVMQSKKEYCGWTIEYSDGQDEYQDQ